MEETGSYHIHPNLLVGFFSFLMLLIGVILKGNNLGRTGNYLLIAAFGLGFIHWIWAIITVFINKELDERSRIFWMTLVVIMPPLGGMYYYLMKRKNVRM